MRAHGVLVPSWSCWGSSGLRVWDPRLRAGAAAAAREPRAVLGELPDGTCGATSEQQERGTAKDPSLLPWAALHHPHPPTPASIPARRFRLRLPQALSHRAWERGRKAGWRPARPRMHLLPESRLNHTPALRSRHGPGGRAAHSSPGHGTQRGTVQHGNSLLRASRAHTDTAHRPPSDAVQLLGLPPRPQRRFRAPAGPGSARGRLPSRVSGSSYTFLACKTAVFHWVQLFVFQITQPKPFTAPKTAFPLPPTHSPLLSGCSSPAPAFPWAHP